MCSSRNARISSRARFASEAGRIAADAPQAVAQRLSSRLRQIEHLIVQRAGHAAAADAGQSVFARFLGKEIDDFQRMLKPNAGIAQCAHDLQPGGDAGYSIEPPARRHGIAVRPDRDHPE
jgi:hypothetical protein